MTRTTRTTTALIAASIAAVLTLGACSATTPDEPATTVTTATDTPAEPAGETTTPEVEEAPEAEAFEAGQKVGEDDEDAVREQGLGVYEALDGERVVFDPAAPLPKVVVKDVRSTYPSKMAAKTDMEAAQASSKYLTIARALALDSKVAVLIRQGGVYDTVLKETWWSVTANGEMERFTKKGANRFPTEAAALAAAKEEIAKQPNSERFEIVPLD